MNYEDTPLWGKTLGIQGDQNIDRLRTSYISFRNNMSGLLDEVRRDFPNLTDHSIDHVDNLWRLASLIIGENYPINPLEGYILGCSFLVHDSILSYEAFGGKDTLRNTIEWKDCYQDIIGTEYDTEDGKQKIDFKVIRQLHAKKCGDILLRQFAGIDNSNHYLLTDDEMREHYGQLIGEIASSHHWETKKILGLPSQVNGLASFPANWIICPRKLACILRCADAVAIDSGRAPDYLFHLLRLNGVSRDHWIAQNRLGVAPDINDPTRMVITSTNDFEEKDFSAWNVAYDAVQVINEELEKCSFLLPEQERFQVKCVAGAKSRKALSAYIKTRGWEPSDVNVHISDVAHLIMTLGGKELYGKEDLQLIVLRELIQNARDAIHARRLMEGEDNFNGKITVKVSKVDGGVVLSVTDNGVGMSLETISHSLLNFGSSFWQDDSVNIEFPGLKTAGFKSVGQYGIGFFSSFMIAKSIVIETRKYTDGLKDAHLVKFPSGLTLAPIFAKHTSQSTSYSTQVTLLLDDNHCEWPTEYEAKRNMMHSTNFKVPFSAMLGSLVAGLDVDVYYQEFDSESILIHQRLDSKSLDKKAWLRKLSLADYQNDKALDDFIENNYNRLQYIYDDHSKIVGLAAIGTRFNPYQDFLGGSTVGGLLTGLHCRTGEYWIGILEVYPGGAKRNGGMFKASEQTIRTWANEQVNLLGNGFMSDFQCRFRLQLAMQHFKTDPINIAVALCLSNDKKSTPIVFSLDELVRQLLHGRRIAFLDSDFVSTKENEGHGDSYMEPSQVANSLQSNEMLYLPLMNSGFLSYKLVDGIPVKDYGFIDCLYRTAENMGYKLCFSYKNKFARNNFGIEERALMIEIKN
jgi:hypothetical protein